MIFFTIFFVAKCLFIVVACEITSSITVYRNNEDEIINGASKSEELKIKVNFEEVDKSGSYLYYKSNGFVHISFFVYMNVFAFI